MVKAINILGEFYKGNFDARGDGGNDHDGEESVEGGYKFDFEKPTVKIGCLVSLKLIREDGTSRDIVGVLVGQVNEDIDLALVEAVKITADSPLGMAILGLNASDEEVVYQHKEFVGLKVLEIKDPSKPFV